MPMRSSRQPWELAQAIRTVSHAVCRSEQGMDKKKGLEQSERQLEGGKTDRKEQLKPKDKDSMKHFGG